MRRLIFIVAGSAFLAGCQTNYSYVPIINNPENFDIAKAKCEMMSSSTQQGMVAWGSPGYVAGAQLGNAIGNSIRADQFVSQCMTIQGWKRVSAPEGGAKPPSQPSTPKPSAPNRSDIISGIGMVAVADYCKLPLKPSVRQEMDALIKSNPGLVREGRAAGMKPINENIGRLGKPAVCEFADKSLKDMKWR